jgi:hypothetical protein
MTVLVKMPYQYGQMVMGLSPDAIRRNGWSVNVCCFFVSEGETVVSLSLNNTKKVTTNGMSAMNSAINIHWIVRPTLQKRSPPKVSQSSSSSSGLTAAK